MAEYVVTVAGIEPVIGKLRPDLYQPALHTLVADAAALAERTAYEASPRDTGALARSITSAVQRTEARVYSPLPYAPVVELGRRPGARMPPPAALTGWLQRHGLAGVAPFVVARAIGRRGIRGRFFFQKAAAAVAAAMPSLAAKAAAHVQEVWRR